MKTIRSAFEARPKNGFTMIELLIVIVILGILAGIAMPHFFKTKERAYMAAMKSDLRNLVTAEEHYFVDNMAYTNSLAAMGYNSSAKVTLAITLDATPPVGFVAIATHPGTAETCAIFISAPAQAPATTEGAPQCT